MVVWVYSLFGVFVIPFPLFVLVEFALLFVLIAFALLFVLVEFALLFVFTLLPVFVLELAVLLGFDVPVPFPKLDAELVLAFWLLLSLFSFCCFSCALFSPVFSLAAFSVVTFSVAAVESLLFLM